MKQTTETLCTYIARNVEIFELQLHINVCMCISVGMCVFVGLHCEIKG